MGYANQVLGGGDGEAVAKRLAGAGAAGLIVADLTPDEGAPFEAVARAAGLAVVYLVAPTTPPARRAPGRRPERRLPVLRVARRRDRRADVAADDGRAPDPRRPRRVAGPGRGRVRGQPARPTSAPSRRPAPTASSSPRRWSTRSDPTAATSTRWPAWSASFAWRPGRTDRILLGDGCQRRDRRGIDPQADLRVVDRLARLVPQRQGPDPALERRSWRLPARYADVAALAGEAFPPGEAASFELELVESVEGGGGTDFGVPSAITPLDGRRSPRPRPIGWPGSSRPPGPCSTASPPGRRPSCARARAAAAGTATRWSATSTKPITAYAQVLGIKVPAPDRSDMATVTELRTRGAGRPPRRSDGSPIAGRKWPPRYAARRIAWHALDHAWEMEDRSEPR